jgi:hypothetical protein
MTLTETTTAALIRDMRRFQRAAGAATALHRPDGSGKCRECRKPWACPTETALLTGFHWDGREDDDIKGEANDGRP